MREFDVGHRRPAMAEDIEAPVERLEHVGIDALLEHVPGDADAKAADIAGQRVFVARDGAGGAGRVGGSGPAIASSASAAS